MHTPLDPSWLTLGLRIALVATVVLVVPLMVLLPATAQDPQPTTAQPQPQPQPAKPAESALSQLDREMTALADKAQRCVARLTLLTKVPLPFPDENGRQSSIEVPVTYSGIILRREGWIVTLADSVTQASEIRVSLPDGRECEATHWATDPRTNLCVLKLQGLKSEDPELTPAEFADSEAAKLGQFVLICGNPFGLTRSISNGMLTGVDRTVVVDRTPFFGVLQTNATINPGDPGGVCMNAQGQVVGMVWSTFGRTRVTSMGPSRGSKSSPPVSDTFAGPEWLWRLFEMMRQRAPQPNQVQPSPEELEREFRKKMNEMFAEMARNNSDGGYLGAEGIHFVLPSNLVRFVADELIDNKDKCVRRGQLGIHLQRVSLPDRTPALKVVAIAADGPAAKAGVLKDDVLLSMGGRPMTSISDGHRAIQTRRAGETIKLVVLRGDKRLEFEATLAALRDRD